LSPWTSGSKRSIKKEFCELARPQSAIVIHNSKFDTHPLPLALDRLTGLKLYDFKCVWFDESDNFDFSNVANSLDLTNINANANLKKIQ